MENKLENLQKRKKFKQFQPGCSFECFIFIVENTKRQLLLTILTPRHFIGIRSAKNVTSSSNTFLQVLVKTFTKNSIKNTMKM